MTDHTPYYVPKEPGRWRAITLAAAVHIALLVFFWIGIDWQSETPIAVQAEIWDLNAREAAPLPQPKPQPKPEPKPEPKPIIKPVPPKVEPEPVTPPPPKVDIALEKEKKRKEQERKDKVAAQEHQEQLKKQKVEEQARKEQAKEKADKEQAEKDKKKKIEQDKKREQEAAQLKAAKAAEMRRLTEAVGSGGAGKAGKSQGIGRADASYLQKIGARIRSNTIFNVPEALSGNPAVEYDVELLPDGSVRGMRLRKSSGLPGFDEAVKRAIDLSQPFPPDNSGRVPSSFTVVHKPKDQ